MLLVLYSNGTTHTVPVQGDFLEINIWQRISSKLLGLC